VSVPDLVEDKQRANAIMTNLMLKGTEDALIPVLLYDDNIIEDPNMLNPEYNKAVGVSGNPNNVVSPLPRNNAQIDAVNYVMERLNASAERAMATPEMQQGMTA